MPAQLRRISEDQYPNWRKNLELTYGFDSGSDEDTFRPLVELDRTFGHFDNEKVVSTLSAFSLELSVPGDVVNCGGTTVVSVAPTHRRQGLLNEMMTAHLDDVRERSEPIAALWASESEIYGRFGYGRASNSAKVTIRRPQAPFDASAAAPGTVRVIDKDEAKALLPGFHDRYRLDQPGMFKRSEAWWENRIFSDLPSRRSGYTANRWAVVDGGDGIEGYTRYRVKSDQSEDGHSAGDVSVLELFGTTPSSWSGLWHFIINQDLISTFTASLRSPEDPIFDLLAGPRRAQSMVNDGIWVRIMDVANALEARSYQGSWAGVLRVHDDRSYAEGTFEVELASDGTSVESSSKEPDIEIQASDLGQIYLGRSALAGLARAGRVAGDLDTLRAVDRAFAWDPQPWCPEIF